MPADRGVTIMVMDELLHTVLLALWFFLPAGVANVTPIFAAFIPGLRRLRAPLDFGLKFNGEPLLGPNKTWRGLIIGVALGSLTFWLQQQAVQHYAFFADIVRDVWTPTLLPLWTLGPLLGLGALGGDAIESFLKRRSRIAPGQPWVPYDQFDSTLGAIALSALVIVPPLAVYAAGLVLWAGIQTAAQYLGFWAGIKERPI